MSLLERVKTRLSDETVSDILLNEYLQTIRDRLALRLAENTVPDIFESVVVDAAVKMHRRAYYEGISSESGATLSASFVDDILNEYQNEIDGWLKQKNTTDCFGDRKKVTFL